MDVTSFVLTCPQVSMGQKKGFSPVCSLRWICRLLLAVKDFSHPSNEQRNGLSLVLRFHRRCECSCDRMCFVRLPL
jgi:hypothetical protein